LKEIFDFFQTKPLVEFIVHRRFVFGETAMHKVPFYALSGSRYVRFEILIIIL